MFRGHHSFDNLTACGHTRRVAAGALLLVLLNSSVLFAADEQSVLAQCAVRLQPVREPVEPSVIAGPSAVTRQQNAVNRSYRRNASGDWDIPNTVDTDDSVVRFLLITPAGPLLTDLSIVVDDNGFRTARNHLIEDVLNDSPPDSAPAESARSPAPGTVAADVAAESPADTDVETRQQPDAVTRLRQYIVQTGVRPDRDEARWLLAQWAPGPCLLELQPGFARDRARLAPLWTALDTDRDNILSAEEIRGAAARLRGLDVDEDDWVTESELVKGHSPLIDSWTSFRLITVLNETTNWSRLAITLRARADDIPPVFMQHLLSMMQVDDASQIEARHLKQLLKAEAALTLQVRFGTENTADRTLVVVRTDDGLIQSHAEFSANDDTVSMKLPGGVVELSAVQPSKPDSNVPSTGQIAIGAVIDGAPLLRLADNNNDRRLTVRETEAFTTTLPDLDGNGDGRITMNELPVPIRFTVTQEPLAHEVLRRRVSAAKPRHSSDSPAAPDWFTGMDRNNDSELTRAEFPGTQDQFRQLDTDGNGRINVREAATSQQ